MQNYAPAQNALGYMYAEGRGVAQDKKSAKKWFKSALNNGLSIANNNLAILKSNSSGYTLMSTKIENRIRATILTEEPFNMNRWLEMYETSNLEL